MVGVFKHVQASNPFVRQILAVCDIKIPNWCTRRSYRVGKRVSRLFETSFSNPRVRIRQHKTHLAGLCWYTRYSQINISVTKLNNITPNHGRKGERGCIDARIRFPCEVNAAYYLLLSRLLAARAAILSRYFDPRSEQKKDMIDSHDRTST